MDFKNVGLLNLVGWSETLSIDEKLVYPILHTLLARDMTHFEFATPRNFVEEIRTIFTVDILGRKLLPVFTPQ